jgi:hypothetical protein
MSDMLQQLLHCWGWALGLPGAAGAKTAQECVNGHVIHAAAPGSPP